MKRRYLEANALIDDLGPPTAYSERRPHVVLCRSGTLVRAPEVVDGAVVQADVEPWVARAPDEEALVESTWLASSAVFHAYLVHFGLDPLSRLGRPPPTAEEGPVNGWTAVAKVVGVSVDTVARRRKKAGDERSPTFPSAEDVHAWWASLHQGGVGSRARPKKRGRPKSARGASGAAVDWSRIGSD